MLCSQDRQPHSKRALTLTNMDARRWLGRSVLVLGGVALLVVAHSDNKYRGLEVFAGAVLLVLGGISGAIDLLLIFAAKTVKPRKLGND